MDASRKKDLTYLLTKMTSAVDAFHSAAITIGVEGLIHYANRARVYIERCQVALRQDEDFSAQLPQSELLAQLDKADRERAQLLETLAIAQREIEEYKALRYITSPTDDFWSRVEEFERAAYRRVENDLIALNLWAATESGHWVLSDDGSLLSAVRRVRRERSEETPIDPELGRPVLRAVPITHTQRPQDFRAGAKDYRDPSSLPPPEDGVPPFEVPPVPDWAPGESAPPKGEVKE